MKPHRFKLTLRDRFGMPVRFALTVWGDSNAAAFRLFHTQTTALGRRLADSTPAHYSRKEDAYELAR